MKFLVCGSANIDELIKVDHFPKDGETILAHGFSKALGGKGLNQAVALHRQGGQVITALSIGNDSNGEMIRNFLVEEDLKGFIHESELVTGRAIIENDPRGENIIIVISGANHDWPSTFVDGCLEHLDGVQGLLLQLEIPLPVIRRLLVAAKEKGVFTILNPAPMNQGFVEEVLPFVDLLVCNEGEAEMLFASTTLEEISFQERAHLIVTKGSQGAQYYHQGKVIRVPATRVRAVDTTGAGDTYLGALLAHWTQGIVPAMKKASLAAGLSVTKDGAIPSIPTKEAVQDLLEKD